MKILHLADLHIGNLANSVLVNGKQSKILEIDSALTEVSSYIYDNKIECVIIAGDIFNHHNPSPDNIALFINFLRIISERKLTVHIIPGNHDCSILSTALSPINEFPWHNISVTSRGIGSLFIEEEKVCLHFIPYDIRKAMGKVIDEKKYILEEVKLTKNAKNILVGHFEIAGCSYGSEREFINLSEALTFTSEELPLEAMLLGHIHKHQIFNHNGIPVVYCGSLICNNFGEKDEQKGFGVYDTDTGDYQFIPLKKGMKYKELNINFTTMDDLIKVITESDINGAYVKVIINTEKNKRELIIIDSIKKLLLEKNVFSISSLEINVTDNTIAVRNKTMTTQIPPQEALKKYIETNNYKELSDDLLREGTKILNEIE